MHDNHRAGLRCGNGKEDEDYRKPEAVHGMMMQEGFLGIKCATSCRGVGDSPTQNSGRTLIDNLAVV